MYPQSHFLLPFLLAELLVNRSILTTEHAIIAGLIGVFVDIDHFLYHMIVHKNFSLRKTWHNAVVVHEHGQRTFLHHTKGFILMTAICAILYFTNITWFWIVALGYYTHMFLDHELLNPFKRKKRFQFTVVGFEIDLSFFELIFNIALVVAIYMIM